MPENQGDKSLAFLLEASGKATRTGPEGRGDWEAVGDGFLAIEARIRWHDNWRDTLRLENGIFWKIARIGDFAAPIHNECKAHKVVSENRSQ
jgi:hypothetical protein